MGDRPEVSRFAPSTTGPAHPGTLLAALLCWLDARASGSRLILRLEDLDPERSRAEWGRSMRDDFSWLGLDWDEVVLQSEATDSHEAALDALASAGRLYPCRCSRREIAEHGTHAPDGGWRYPNTCRARALPAEGWRASDESLRVRLPEGVIEPRRLGGEALAQNAGAVFGDPVVRRRDGAIAYHLASVVDDASIGVTKIVRGRDLAASTATQVALQQLLDLPWPSYRHHLLLLERTPAADGAAAKLAKLHGAVSAQALRRVYAAPELCGWLAQAAGLCEEPTPVTPGELVGQFDWERVRSSDPVVAFDGQRLQLET